MTGNLSRHITSLEELVKHVSTLLCSSMFILYFSLKVNNCSFHHASPRLWNELPKDLRQPVNDKSLMSLSFHLSLTGSASSPSSSPLLLCITPSLFHSTTPDSKLTFSKNPSHHSLPHLFRRISRIFITISGLKC